jgi:phage gpG-like protein
MPKKGSFNFKKTIHNWESLKKTLPKVIGDEAVNHFQSNFPEQGFDGQKWPKRKRDKTPGRAVLIKSGRLRRSIRLRKANFTTIKIATDVPYAKIHNEGGTINHPGGSRVLHFKKNKRSGKTSFSKSKSATYAQRVNAGPYQIHMPKRQFMGSSRKLDKKVLKILTDKVGSIFK